MSAAQFFLAPFALVYYCGLALDRWFRSLGQRRLPRPVISVGNISVGGTGKTPLLIRLISDVQKHGAKPAVLSRGYRGVGKGSGGLNDEAMLVMSKDPHVPVALGADRAAQADALLKKERVDVFLLDDGFQHWPLARNLDIVCVDATQPLNNFSLLPAGRLREPASALKRAGLVAITRSELASPDFRRKIESLVGEAAVIDVRFDSALIDPFTEKKQALSSLDGQAVLAVSAIGNPDAFELGLERAGAKVTSYRCADHHDYTSADWSEILDAALEFEATIVTTEKDWVKLKALTKISPARRLLVSQLTVSFSGDDERLWNKTIDKVLHETTETR